MPDIDKPGPKLKFAAEITGLMKNRQSMKGVMNKLLLRHFEEEEHIG
jgi:hypothetical protein